MKIKNLLFIAIINIPIVLFSQVELNTIDEVKEYIEGEWQLTKHVNGWAGENDYPTDSLDYRLKFEIIENSNNKLECISILNQTIIQESIINITYDEELHWSFNNIPVFLDYYWTALYMYEDAITVDSFDVHDAFIDGNALRFSKVGTSSILSPSIIEELKIYPNPSSNHITVEGIDIENLRKIRIFNGQGQLLKESLRFQNNQLELPDVSSLLILEILMKDGAKEVRLVNKI